MTWAGYYGGEDDQFHSEVEAIYGSRGGLGLGPIGTGSLDDGWAIVPSAPPLGELRPE